MQLLYAQLTLTVTPSNYNGSNISCFGAQDGSITANPTGGTAPYSYIWSNQETGQSINSLAAGYYRVQVTDMYSNVAYAEITLTQPEDLTIENIAYIYSNSYNISCWSCSNGIIDIYVDNGTPPYTFLWDDGNTNQSRTNLSPGNHYVTATDANGCTINSEQVYLTEPDRSDWTILGNTGSNPSNNFIGTTDSVAVSFRTNNTERLKIGGNGKVKINSLSGGINMVYVDSNGVLKAGNDATSTICQTYNAPVWWTTFNATAKNLWTCPDVKVAIGGGYVPANYMLGVDGGIICTEVKVKNRLNWPDYVLEKGYKKISLDDLENYIFTNHHLPDVISAKEEEKDGHELGEMDALLLKKIEELTLYIIDLNKRNNQLEQSLNAIKHQFEIKQK